MSTNKGAKDTVDISCSFINLDHLRNDILFVKNIFADSIRSRAIQVGQYEDIDLYLGDNSVITVRNNTAITLCGGVVVRVYNDGEMYHIYHLVKTLPNGAPGPKS